MEVLGPILALNLKSEAAVDGQRRMAVLYRDAEEKLRAAELLLSARQKLQTSLTEAEDLQQLSLRAHSATSASITVVGPLLEVRGDSSHGPDHGRLTSQELDTIRRSSQIRTQVVVGNEGACIAATPILVKGTVFGFVVATSREQYSAEDLASFRLAASLAAGFMAAESIHREASSTSEPQIIPTKFPCFVAVAAATVAEGISSAPSAQILNHKLHQLAANNVGARTAGGTVAMLNERVVILWPQGSKTLDAACLAALHSTVVEFQEQIPTCVVSIAVVEADESRNLASALASAGLAADVRQLLKSSGVVANASRVDAPWLVAAAARSHEAVEMCRAVVERVRSERDASLLLTYRAYLDAAGSVGATAEALNVHPHTVQYRLKRFQELTGLSLSSPHDRLTLELAVRILEMARLLETAS
jgi:hypothetical protein